VSSTNLQEKSISQLNYLLSSLLVHGLVIPLALTIPITLMRLEFPTLFSLNISKYYTVLLFLLYIYQLCNFLH